MYKILVVEDEELIRTMIKINLSNEGHEVSAFSAAEGIFDELKNKRYDIILLDIMLPGITGIEALEKIRKMGINTPVLMLTAKTDVESKVASLELGSDDYLTKPFNMDELIARVKAIIRRSQSAREIPAKGVVSIGAYDVNLETRTAQTNAGEVALSEKEANLLALFVKNPGKVLSRADILEEVWGMDVNPTERTVDNFVLRLRKLFEKDPENPKHFITVRASGYRFEP
ncbi:MAG: response regulator transcription factor [Myxococcota bacterium]